MNVLDQIFWKRFADEYKLDPANPGPACVAGMFQVGIILFMTFMGIFELLVRSITLLLAAAGAETAARIWHPMEFRAMLLLAGISAGYMVKHRYWSRRLHPEDSRQYGEALNRGVITLFVAGLMSAAAVVMFLAFTVVRSSMNF